MTKSILEILKGKTVSQPPWWLMRQAGRYLPEYLEVRTQAGSFLNLAYTPELASEVTLQPVRRYGMDGAILFSDILVVPHALGMDLKFETGEGPVMTPLENAGDFQRLNLQEAPKIWNPVFETVKQTCNGLSAEGFKNTTMIGFAGSPWTIACYMIEGRGKTGFKGALEWTKHHPEWLEDLFSILEAATVNYLSGQIDAGAEVIKLFDSWAGLLEGEDFERWITKPTTRIIKALKEQHPQTPIIGFPRHSNLALVKSYAQTTGIDGLALDYSISLEDAAAQINLPLQGNLNPDILLGDEKTLASEVHKMLYIMRGRPYIFNLGHGIDKTTNPAMVQKLAQLLK